MESRTEVFVNRVLHLVQEADEIGGLEGVEYAKAMLAISKECHRRATVCLHNLLEEAIHDGV
jgi:hypothetical protein